VFFFLLLLLLQIMGFTILHSLFEDCSPVCEISSVAYILIG
jgi:hypothetical protein